MTVAEIPGAERAPLLDVEPRVSFEQGELLVRAGGSRHGGATGYSRVGGVVGSLPDRLAHVVADHQAIWQSGIGGRQSHGLEASVAHAVEPPRLGDVDHHQVVLFGGLEILDAVRLAGKPLVCLKPGHALVAVQIEHPE